MASHDYDYVTSPVRHTFASTRLPTPPPTQHHHQHQGHSNRRMSEDVSTMPTSSRALLEVASHPLPPVVTRQRSASAPYQDVVVREFPLTTSRQPTQEGYQRKHEQNRQEESTETDPLDQHDKHRAAARDSFMEWDPFTADFTGSVNETESLSSPYTASSFEPAFPAPLRITKIAVRDVLTNNTFISITRNAVHLPSPFSTKPLLTLTRTTTGQPVGSIRFHMAKSAIDIDLHGVGHTRMEHDGRLPTNKNRWKFESMLKGNGISGPERRFYYWCKDRHQDGGWELRDNGRKGHVVARIEVSDAEELLLEFEKMGMGEREVEEVLISAVALVEALRRSHKDEEWSEVQPHYMGPHAVV